MVLKKGKQCSNSSDSSKILKCVLVGDGYVGKTCLLSTFVTGTFPAEYRPTIFDNHSVIRIIDGESYSFCLFDTAGQEDFDRIRSLAYYNADVFIICFALDSEDSFRNVSNLWIKELKNNPQSKRVPIILLCTKLDLRDDKSLPKVSQHRIHRLAKDIKADKYLECSALKKIGLNAVFDEAFNLAFQYSSAKTSSSHCCIL